jgi:hypothetical protein
VRKRGRDRERGNVLYLMVVTLDVSHFERSPLNTEADSNAIQKKQEDQKLDRKRKERTILLIKDSLSNIR